ncbi:A/G-specific adenine glycosylase [uncultured Megasphaera sp.]|uniref:A/G-specific adenine glycosylase n=1 Tax=uncultured Megasphaera sp. TaxID=165188 RepID=UPI00259654FA|nr:A/G-specific adenine glycosylase [uncultured Megasphaera sp.]
MTKEIKKIDPGQWAQLLLHWFYANRRDLPWRTVPRDPYKVWVSEIMLQQTKVEAVRPYYESWMDRFPTVQALAAASEDDVLRQWQGLGYYSRARNLHDAVCEVQREYGGKVPDTLAGMRSLKGVGDYTAGAVLSIAYKKPVPAVDGNVLRIFARLYVIEDNILSAKVKKSVTALAAKQVPPDAPGDFNEALMDLGATVCIPKHPRCDTCPLQKRCGARALGKETELPVRLTRKHVPVEEITVVAVADGQRWLLHRRPSKGLLASMWEFPNAVGAGEAGLEAVQRLVQDLGLSVAIDDQPVGTLRHVFSHKIWQMTIYTAECTGGTLETKEDWQWLDRSCYTDVPWAGPHGKITAMV